MTTLRALLSIGLLICALSTLWAGHVSFSDAPEECMVCVALEDPSDMPTDAYGVLMHRLDLAGDPPDPFVAEPARLKRPHAKPEQGAATPVLPDPESARVLLRPPRVA